MGAGLIPIAYHNNNLYFLFGLEYNDNKWGDFGGKANKNESRFNTALREGYEELNGILGNKNDFKKKVQNNLITKINKNDNTYSTYLFEIEYNDKLDIYFNNFSKFINLNFSNLIDKKGFFENKEIKWFSIADLKKNKSKFRIWYQEIINIIISNENNLQNIKWK